MKIKNLEVGQVVYAVEKRDSMVLGMTKSKKPLKTIAVLPVYIKEVNVEEGYVMAKYNGNSERKFREGSIAKWKKEKPMTVNMNFGLVRLATKEERGAAKK